MTPDRLPLVLSGPVLRRVDRGSVTVWIALRQACRVRLRVFDSVTRAERMSGEARTVRIGEYIHVVAVTAASETGLNDGALYEYDIELPDLDETLATLGLTGEPEGPGPFSAEGRTTLCYPGFRLPAFLLPPRDVTSVRLLHGSCRKPHGEGPDALATADYILAQSAHDPERRPQILLLTGDQIYADDVADNLLQHLIDFGAQLFEWPGGEPLPGDASDDLWKTDRAALLPGRRTQIAEEQAGLTGMLPNTPEKTNSHLLTFTEFAVMHLCAWSDVLWPEDLPPGDPAETERLERFRKTLPNVRRALANVATCMVCDDHEITDDWYFNLAWCRRVLAKPLGRATLRNGLLAYAVFQAWGNTPEQFEPGRPGRRLLDALSDWTGRGGAPDPVIERLLSIPTLDEIENNPNPGLVHADGALDWHYNIRGPEDAWQILVLDTRTWRGFRGDATDPSELMNPAGISRQVGAMITARPDGVVIVVSSTPVIGIPLIQAVQSAQPDFRLRLAFDVEFWKAQDTAFEGLIATLARDATPSEPRRVVLLSGDVHFGYAAWLRYWADRPHGSALPRRAAAVFAQLNSSPFRNQTQEGLNSTTLLHQRGYDPFHIGRPISALWRCAGWNGPQGEPPELIEWNAQDELPRRPDWHYVIGYVGSTASEHRKSELEAYLKAADAEGLTEGQEIVGVNHIGEITFSNGGHEVTQELWWNWRDFPAPYPLSRYVVPLTLQESR